MQTLNKTSLQGIADHICDKYGIDKIIVMTYDKASTGRACYNTWRIKGGTINNPVSINIYNYNETGQFIEEISHELSHHIMNCKHNSLKHDNRFYCFNDDLEMYIYRTFYK